MTFGGGLLNAVFRVVRSSPKILILAILYAYNFIETLYSNKNTWIIIVIGVLLGYLYSNFGFLFRQRCSIRHISLYIFSKLLLKDCPSI